MSFFSRENLKWILIVGSILIAVVAYSVYQEYNSPETQKAIEWLKPLKQN